MRSRQPLSNGNGEAQRFQSTVSVQKLRRFNILILLFRAATFCFSLAAAVFTLTNTRGPSAPHWYDFDAYRKVFAYLLVSANSAGTTQARTLRGMDTCTATNAFCVQSDAAIALGFAGFMFLGFSSLLSGFRVVCFMINGSRFHI